MKSIFTAFALLLLLAASARATQITTYPYCFVPLSGDTASGIAPVSQTDYNTGSGPNYFAGDRSNDPFVFSFNTPLGTVSYLDFFGFDFTLSEDRNQLYANGSITQIVFGGGFVYASFITGADGITTWNGSFEAGGQIYNSSGAGQWLRGEFCPTATAVPEGGATLVLLMAPVLLLFLVRRHLATGRAA